MPDDQTDPICIPRSRRPHPNVLIIAALSAFVLIALVRPSSVENAEHSSEDITASTTMEHPRYPFDPGPRFYDPASIAAAPHENLALPFTKPAGSLTYNHDIGPGFFELVEGGSAQAEADGQRSPVLSNDGSSGPTRAGTPGAKVPDDGVMRLHVEDFGAVPSADVDNRQAIQDAIDYAFAFGGGVIMLGEGVYGVAGDPEGPGSIKLKSNTFLQGAGMGRSVLRLVDGWSGKLVGLVRTPHGRATLNYGMADLTLDGNRQATSGKVDAYYSGGRPGDTVADEDAWVLRVEVRDFSGYGFDPHERTVRLTIADSIARNNGTDGFVADHIINGVYRRNLAIGNGRHGFNIVTTSNSFVLEDSVAEGNGGVGVVVQRGDEAIQAPHNLRIGRMRLTDNDREGVLVRLSHDVELFEIMSARNGTYGIRIQGSRNVTLRDSVVMDNSRIGRGQYAAIQIRDEEDAVTGQVYPAREVVVRDNVIGWQVPTKQQSAVQELKGDVSGTIVSGNHFRGLFRHTVQIGSRSTESKNHRFEAEWITTALRGLAGALPESSTVDCQSADVRPQGCVFPERDALWPAGLE